MQLTRAADKYSPLYFLASVGAGGLAVTFFMYLMFWVPHPGRPVPIFEDITAAWATGTLGLKAAIAVAVIGIAVMVVMNLQKLFWNIGAYNAWKQTDAYQKVRNSNAETTLLAYPLALAMSVNGLFIAGLVFVPGLWNIVEYLFPFALAAFLAIGLFALSIIGDFLGRVLTKGGVFDVTAHNSFAQLLPSFALSMVAVGLAAPAAMSTNQFVVSAGVMTSTFFGTAALVYGLLALFTAFNSMLHYGTAKEAAPTLMIIIPIMTILGIMMLRQSHGLHVTFDVETNAGETMVFLSRVLSIQFLFLLLGVTVLLRQGYFKDFVFGSKTSPGSYALVCPGVALSVMIQFFVNKGLVDAGIIDKFGVIYWVETAVAIGFQLAMVWLVLRLNKQHFARTQAAEAVPAE
ncbi:TsoY family (seleno)protein [Sinisalibacter lacisalsi]|uniref:Uncharacterized protein n=1 Tax=Sinisalibacter lacisalsi TaxID=1526570 RepID=A0ABQ1QPM1_9RHOB|nr:hypothetical protein [Sinisalibacter lacisalsi]GGD36607.1 hypothetical protein GCM10011358_20540 [Sinisalibacter lacisalsi]